MDCLAKDVIVATIRFVVDSVFLFYFILNSDVNL